MALTSGSLNVWDIGFRWANHDPDQLWFRLPLLAKDNFRVLMQAILSGELLCETLTLAKRPPNSKADPAYYIHTYIDEVYECIHGVKYNRKLLKWAHVDRHRFYDWCELREIPKPEFWFPPDWKYDYEIPEGGTAAMWAQHVEPEDGGIFSISYKSWPGLNLNENDGDEPLPESKTSRENQLTRIACQRVAREIWKEDLSRTITSIVEDPMIQKYCGASYYNNGTVRGWIKEIAPSEVSSRRGRPPKNSDKADKN